MGGLNSGPGPGITLLIAIVLVLAQTASSAPLYEEDEGQESNSQALAESHGCYYNFQHYNEGERILTNEPCLNCTCRNRMLMCYLRVCPFTKGIGQNCTVEKVPGQCCPIITCPEVPVQLLTSTTTEGIKTPGSGVKGTAVGHLDTNGCNIDGVFYPNGAQVPGSPEKPCELCYCIRNKTACIMQECALHVDGCRPVYEEGQCFPVRYQCDDSPYEDEPTTTIRPAPTPGLVITTTSSEPLDCVYNSEVYEDGSRIQTEDPCEHCYCLKGKIACAVQECGAPLEKEGQNCTALPPAPGKCCPDSYQCDITMTSQGNESGEGTTEAGIPSVADAGHPTDGYRPDQGTRTTEGPKHTTDRLHQVTEAETASKGTPDVKPQELDKGTQNELTESHLQGLHPMKPGSTSDKDQKITFPDAFKPSKVDRPEETGTEKPESDHTMEGHVIHMPHEKQPHPESESHKQDSTTDSKHPQTSQTDPSQSHEQNVFKPTVDDVQRPQTSSSSTKDPLLDKLHNIIQDVQSQVSDGKTTETPAQVDYQTTPQSQTGHFTDKPDILSHLPHFGSQPSTSSSIQTGNTTGESSPEDSSNIIDKLQGIIQGIYSHVTDSGMHTKTPDGTTVATDTQPSQPAQSESELNRVPDDGSKPVEVQRPYDTEYPSEHATGKPKPEDGSYEGQKPVSGSEHSTKTPPDAYPTEYPKGTGETGVPDSGKPDAVRPQGSIKLPQRPKPGSADEPYATEYPETTDVSEEDSYTTEGDGSSQSKYPGEGVENTEGSGLTKTPLDKEKYPEGYKPTDGHFDGKPLDQSLEKHPEQYSPESKPTGQDSEGKPFGTEETPYGTEYPEGFTGKPGDETPSGQYPGKVKPGQQYPEGSKPSGTFDTEETSYGTKYPDRNKPVEEYPDSLKPSSQYPQGERPTGGKPEKYKPGQYSEGTKPEEQSKEPGQKYPEGSGLNEQYPEKTKPFGTEDTPYGTEYPEGSTGRPEDFIKYPEGLKPTGEYPEKYKPGGYPGEIKPSGQYPAGFKPGQQYPEGSRPTSNIQTGQNPDKKKPFGTEETPYGTEYPEGVTGRPEYYTKYPGGVKPSGQYPEKYRPQSGYYPEKYKPGQHPEGLKPEAQSKEPGQQYPNNVRPDDYTKYPEGVRPTGQYPVEYKPGQHPSGMKPSEQYPEGLQPEEQSKKPGQQYPEGSRPTGQYPEKTKPFETEETPYGTEYPEGVTGRPEDFTKYPGGVKPSGQYPEKYRPGQYPEGAKPGEQSNEPGQRYPQESRPTEQYPEKTKPFGTEDTQYGTEYPEGATGRPEDYTKYPDGVRPSDQYPGGVRPSGQYPEKFKPGQYPEGFKPDEQSKKPGQQYPEKTKPFGTEETPYGTEYPEGATGRPEDYTKFPEGLRPTGQYPDEYKPGQYPAGVRPSGQDPEKYKPGQYHEGLKPEQSKQPGQQYPQGSKPNGQYPEKPKPFGVEETPYGTEYPEGVTGRPEDYPGGDRPSDQYPGGLRPSGQYPEKYKPGQYPEGIKPEGQSKEPGQQYPEKTKPFGSEETPYGTEYPEGATGKPEDFTKYPEGVRPSGQYPAGFSPSGQPEKPVQQYPQGSRPAGQYPDKKKPFGTEETSYGTEYPEGATGRPEDYTKYPEGARPSGQYPEGVKPEEQSKEPGQRYPIGVRPTGQYPEKTKPFGTEETPYGTEYPEGATGRPEDYTKYPQGVKPIGHYPDKSKPGQHPEGFKPTDKLKPGHEIGFTTDETSYGNGRPEGVTGQPDDDTPSALYPEKTKPGFYPDRHRPAGQYPEKQKPGQEYPEGSRPSGQYSFGTEKIPYGTEYPEGVTSKPEDYTKYPEGVKPSGQYPEKYRPGQYPESFKPDEESKEPGQKYPIGMRPIGQYPEKTKPFGTEETLYGTEYPEGATGRPEDYPGGVRPTGQYPGEVRPSGQYPENYKPGQYPEGFKPEEQSKKPGQQYPEGSRPTGQYPEKTKPFGTEETPYGTEYPEGVTGRPDDYTKYPEGVKPNGQYPEKYKPGQYPEGFKPEEQSKKPGQKYPQGSRPTEQYPEKTKPFGTEETPYGTGYSEGIRPTGQYPDGVSPSKQNPESVKPEEQSKEPGQSYPIGFRPSGKYPEKKKPFGTDETPYGTEYPESSTGRPEDYTKYPEGLKPTGEYPEKYKPGQYPDEVKPSGEYPEKYKPEQYPEGLTPEEQSKKPGQKYPEGSKPTGQYPEKIKPFGSEETPYGTEYPESATGRPEDYNKYPEGSRPTGQYPGEYKPGEYPEDVKPGDFKPGQQYPEHPQGVTGKPAAEYPNKTKPSKEHPEHYEPGQYPHGVKPTGKYPEGGKPVGEYPFGTEEVPYTTEYPEGATERPEDYTKYPGEKPSGQYPEKFRPGQYPEGFKPDEETKKPGQHSPEGNRPTEEYPEKTKPFGNEEAPYGTEYPEGATGRPENYPGGFRPTDQYPGGMRPSGQYPEKYKPGQYPEKTKPIGSEETPYGTEYPEGATGRPEDYTKYPGGVKPSEQYPEKYRPSQYPEGFKPEEQSKEPGQRYPIGVRPTGQYPEKTKPFGSEETPYGTEYPEGATGKPEDFTKYPEGVRPSGQYPAGFSPSGQPEKPVQQYPQGSRPAGQYPDKKKPFGTEETSYGTEYPEGATGRPEDYTKYPEGIRPTGQYPEEFKPGQYPGGVSPSEQYPEEVNPEEESKKPGQQYPEGLGPTGQYPEKTKPFGTEETPYTTEYPEGATGRPIDYTKYPEGIKPTVHYPGVVTDSPVSHDKHPGAEYTTHKTSSVEKGSGDKKPTEGQQGEDSSKSPEEENVHGTEYPEGVSGKPEDESKYPSGFVAPGGVPHGTEYPESSERPGDLTVHPEGSRPFDDTKRPVSGIPQDPEKQSESESYSTESFEESGAPDASTEYPEGFLPGKPSRPEFSTKHPEGKPDYTSATEYPEKPGTSKPEVDNPEGYKPDDSKTKISEGSKYPVGAPDGDGSKPIDGPHGTEKYPEGTEGKPIDSSEYPLSSKYPGTSFKPKPGSLDDSSSTEYPEAAKPYGTDRPEGLKPIEDDKQDPQSQEKETKKPTAGSKYPEEISSSEYPTVKPEDEETGTESGFELYPGASKRPTGLSKRPQKPKPDDTEFGGITSNPDDVTNEDVFEKPQGEPIPGVTETSGSEKVTGKPGHLNKDEDKTQKPEYTQQSSTETGKYPEEAFITHYPEKPKPPNAEDQLLETVTVPDSSKYPEKIESVSEEDKPEEESKPSPSGLPQESETYDQTGGITKSPYYTIKRPTKPSTKRPERPDESKPDETGKPQDMSKYPEKPGDDTKPDSEEKPYGVTGKPDQSDPEGTKQSTEQPETNETSGSEYPSYPTGSVSKRPVEGSKYPEKPDGGTYGTEYPEASTGSSEGVGSKRPQETGVTGRPQVETKYPEESTGRPQDLESPYGTEYPGSKDTGRPGLDQEEDSKPQYPHKVTNRPSEHTKYPDALGSTEKPYGTEYPEGATGRPEDYTKYPEGLASTGGYTGVTGRPTGKYPEKQQSPHGTEYPEGVTGKPEDMSGTQDSLTQHPERPFATDKYPEGSKPQDFESSFGTTYPEKGTDNPDDSIVYPEGVRPTGEQTKHPEGYKPDEQYPGKPYDPSYGTEYPEGVTGRPDYSTKYPEEFKPTGESEKPSGSGEPYGTDKYKPQDLEKPYGTEYPEESTGKPEDYIKYPGLSSTRKPVGSHKYPEEGKPESVYGMEYPEGVTGKPEDSTRYPEGSKPNEEAARPSDHIKYPGEQYPGKPTGYPEGETSKYPEGLAPTSVTGKPDDVIKYTEGVTGRPDDHTKYPVGYKPQGTDKYSDSHDSGSPFGTEFPEKETGTTEESNEFSSKPEAGSISTGRPQSSDKYPEEGTKYPERVTGSLEGFTKYPEGFKPTGDVTEHSEYPEDGKPHGSKYPEGSVPAEEYPDKVKPGYKPESSTEYSAEGKPTESSDEFETGKPLSQGGSTKRPEGFKPTDEYPTGSKHPVTDDSHVSVKPAGSEGETYETGHSTSDRPESSTSEHPQRPESEEAGVTVAPVKHTPSEDDSSDTQYPEVSTEYPYEKKPEGTEYDGSKYPGGVKDKPTGLNDILHSTEYSVGLDKDTDSTETPEHLGTEYPEGATYQPESASLYPGINKRPIKHPQRPKPQMQSPEGTGRPDEDTSRPKPSESEYGPHGTESSEEYGRPSTDIPGEDLNYSQESEKPSKYPQRPSSGTNEEFDETGSTLKPEVVKEPESSLGSEKRPKPTGNQPVGSVDSETNEPDDFGKYPEGFKPSSEYPEESGVTKEPTKYPGNVDYSTEHPEKEKEPEGIAEGAFGKPGDELKPTSEESDKLGGSRYPGKPTENDSTKYPLPGQVTEHPEDDIYGTGVTKKPVSSSGIPTDNLSTKFPYYGTTLQPGTTYLPEAGQVPNEKIPSSEQLGEDSVPEVSEPYAPTEAVGFTDRIPVPGSPSEENLLSNLHHFESLPEKPASADLTHEDQTPSTEYPGQLPTSQGSPDKPDQFKPQDITSERPKPVVPGEGLYNEQYPGSISTAEQSGTSVTRQPSTAKPGSKYPGSVHDFTGDKYPDASEGQPENVGTHKDSTTKQPFEGSTERHPEVSTDHAGELSAGELTSRPVTSTPEGDNQPETQKTTPGDNDLINKLHNIISGIQSQVTDSKTTQLPQKGYDSTSPFGLPTESSTDKFGRPVQKPHDSVRPGQDSSAGITDDVSLSENEIYDQTTIYAEETEGQTDRPEFNYPFGGGSPEQTVGVPTKGPEGIRPDEVEGSLSTQSPDGSKPDQPEGVEYPKPEKPDEYPTDGIYGKPEKDSSSTDPSFPGKLTTQHSEVSGGLTEQTLTSGVTGKPEEGTAERDGSTEHPYIAQGNKPVEGTVTQDTLQTVTPQDASHKYTTSIPTDKPLHVVYPTYYPEGVVTRKPGTKPDEEADKKVTVTPENKLTYTPTVSPDGETHTVYEVQTEISSESSSSGPVVVVHEVHTEVHSERATTKPETEGYLKQTTKPGLESTSGRPQEPEKTVEGFTKYPESSGQTPQLVFGRPAITQPTGDELHPESQTLGPHESEKSPNLPVSQESTSQPSLVTVTPVSFGSVTKESDHIMHLYSPKDKHPGSASSPQYSEPSPTTEKEQTPGFTDSGFFTDSGAMGTRFPSRKTTQKPTDGVHFVQEGTTITPTQGIGEEYQAPHFFITREPSFAASTEGLPAEVTGYTTKAPQGASYVPYKLINGTKVYYPEKESSEEPSTPSSFDGYDYIPYEIVNGTKFFYPNRVVTPQPEFTTTGANQMGMYVPYKIVNGTKVYYTQDKPEKPEKFDGLDYVPFDIVNGTKVFYPERVTTTPPPGSAMYVPFKIVNDTKVYYPKDAKDEPQDIPVEYDGFDYIPYEVVDGKKVFRPDRLPSHVPATTERPLAMYVPYKLINGKKVYYTKDAQTRPESLPEGYDGFDFVPYEVVNGTKVFQPERVTPKPQQTTPAMFVPYKMVNGTKVYFPKYAQLKPTYTPEGFDGFDYLPFEEVNGTKVFRPITQKPEQVPIPAFHPNGMFVPYKIINNKKVFFPKDAQHKPRPLKPGYDGVQYLPYDVINGTKVFHPEAPVKSFMYVPFKFINGTKVYYTDKAAETPEKIPEGFEGFDYLPFEVVEGNKVFYPEKVTPTTGMYVPYKKVNGTKVYNPKDSTEKEQSIPEGYDGVDYIPYEIINGTQVFYPDRATPTQQPQKMYVPFKMVNGTKVYYPKDAQPKPYLVPEGYDGFDSLTYDIVNGTKVFQPDVTERPVQPQGMFVPYKIINGTKVYYPQEAHKRPHPLSDEYAGLDYIPYEIVNGTKVFHPERVTPSEVPAMYVPYKLVNGSKVFYPKHAQHAPQQIPAEYDGFDYLPYEIVNGSQVFYPNRVPSYQGMYVPYKIINGEKVFYPKYAQHKPSTGLDGYDGFDYLPYENVNGTKVFRPPETTENPLEQAMYVPFKVVNGKKVYYPKYAQFKPYLIPEGYDGFDYIPYEIVNETKVFDPEQTIKPYKPAMYVPYKIVNGKKVYYPTYAQKKPYLIPEGYDGFDYIPYEIVNGTKVFDPEQTTKPYKPAMYVPYKIVNGEKVYYPKYAQNKPDLIPEGYDGFDYVPYEIVNGTKVFDPQHSISPGTTYKPALYVPYKIINGVKVYQPKFAVERPKETPQGYDGYDFLLYEFINGNRVFYPEKSTPLEQAMYVPYKIVNGTKVFYPKYAQHVPVQLSEDYDGFEYIPYKLVNGEKVFHPEEATGTPFKQALYVPYKVVNGAKVYYPKYAQYNPQMIPSGYEGFDYLPYDYINGNKVFYPEQSTSLEKAMYVPYKIVNGTKVFYPKYAQYIPTQFSEDYDGSDYIPYEIVNGNKVFHPEQATVHPPRQALYVPFRIANGTKVYYPNYAQPKPQLIPEGFDGFDYLPYEIVNGTKVFDPKVPTKPTYLQGMYVPYKLSNSTKVFYPKDAHNKPNRVPAGYDGADYVPYELVNNTKMFYPELISTAQPGNTGSAGVYVPFKIINNKKVFYPKEATPFPPTVRHPYDGVAFVPNKALPVSEIVYVDNEEALKVSQLGHVPGEGSCYLNNRTFANNSEIPPVSPCQTKCICVSSVVRCVRVKCPAPPENKLDCSPLYREGSCCPIYACGDSTTLGHGVDETTPFADFGGQKKPESGDVKGGSKPEEESPSGEYFLHKPPKPKPSQHESLEPYDNVEGQISPEEDYDVEDEEPYGPGTCRYAGKVYVSAQQIPRDDPCDFCFCFRSDIICLQQSCPPPIPGCRDEPIQGFCCPRYECHVKMATLLNVTSTTTTTTTTLPPHFFPHAFKGSATKTGCFVQGKAYRVGQPIPSASGPCMDCICGGNGRMKCEPKVCTPEPMIRKMINPSENATSPTDQR